MDNNPVVSVAVITYNSSEFIVETLESVKKQTYKNIEMIISDDCSTDDTVEKIEKWVSVNKDRFIDVKLLTAERNTGVACNINRAYQTCHGEWIKGLAGDDLLVPTCIEDNINYSKANPIAQLILSNSIIFYNSGEKSESIQKPGGLMLGFFEMDASNQYDNLVRHEILLNSNSTFVSSKIVREIRFDERMMYMEDRPFFWNVTKNGYRIHYLDKITVRYRKHEGALTGLSGKSLLSMKYYDSWTAFYYIVRKPELEKKGIDTKPYEKKILWYLLVKYILKNKGWYVFRVLNYLVNKFYIKL